MAHILDYSQSAAQLGLSGDNLLGTSGGDVTTDAFWNGLPSQTVDVRIDNGLVSGGVINITPVPVTGSLDPSNYSNGVFLEGGGAAQRDQSGVFTQSNASFGAMPDRLLDGAGSLTFYTPSQFDPGGVGDYIQVNGIDAPQVQFDAPFINPLAAYTIDAVEMAFEQSAEDALDDLFAQMVAIYGQSLSDVESIEIAQVINGNFTGTLNAPESFLIFTPDATSNLTIGDVFSTENLDMSFPKSALFGTVQTDFGMWADEALELHLTGFDDVLDVSLTGAEEVTVYAGEGNDIYTTNSPFIGPNQPPSQDRVYLYGEEGDDTLEVSSRFAHVDGGAGDDFITYMVLNGGDSDSQILGGVGDDSISGSFVGGMTLDGGDGDDFLSGDTTSQLTLIGGAGNDDLRAGSSFDFNTGQITYTSLGQTFDGGAGNDGFLGGNGGDLALGGSGDDKMNLLGGDDTLIGGTGRDTFEFQVGFFDGLDGAQIIGSNLVQDNGGLIDIIIDPISGDLFDPTYERDGQDLVISFPQAGQIRVEAFFDNFDDWEVRLGRLTVDGIRPEVDLESQFFAPVVFTDADDTLTLNTSGSYDAQDGDDTVTGSTGNDTIKGGAGADELRGGIGDDALRGGDGDDELRGGFGEDDLRGGGGNDLLAGQRGNDAIRGDKGNDSIVGQAGDDTVFGGLGNDNIKGGGGADVMNGNKGNDFVKGGAAADVANGGNGSDTVSGNKGDDVLSGGAGQDTLKGGGGNDILTGQRGNDFLKGGAGSDVFVFETGHGNDTVVDFELVTDQLAFRTDLVGANATGAAIVSAFASVTAAGVVFDFGDGDTVTLETVNSLAGLADDISIF